MITSHEDHKCKECKENLHTLMELLKHLEKHHCKEPVNGKYMTKYEEMAKKPPVLCSLSPYWVSLSNKYHLTGGRDL